MPGKMRWTREAAAAKHPAMTSDRPGNWDLSRRFAVRRSEVAACALLGLAVALALMIEVPLIAAILSGYLVTVMLLITLIDARQMIIPDPLSLPAIPLGLVAAVSASPLPWPEVLLDHGLATAAAGFFLLGVRWFYRRTRGVQGLGLGDVKLGAAAGAWIGLDHLALTCLLATGAALAAVLLRKAFQPAGAIGMATAIPFGSFIAPAIAIMWCYRLLAG